MITFYRKTNYPPIVALPRLSRVWEMMLTYLEDELEEHPCDILAAFRAALDPASFDISQSNPKP
jgi:hypothetical protein